MSSSLQETRNSVMYAKLNVSAMCLHWWEKHNNYYEYSQLILMAAPLTSLKRSCLLQLGANGVLDLL